MFLALVPCAGASRAAKLDLRGSEKQIFARINTLRARVDAPPLQWDDAVAAAARQESEEMARGHFFSHNNPERGDLRARLTSAGIPWIRCAENILRENGFDDPVSVAEVEWWYSPGHKENLVNPVYTKSGVGLALSETGFVFATQIFITPLPPGARRR
ncbi:MAG: hypothetical protein JWO80_2281 [Bryobacterales bacterium]|nr:hypothetical protein [Bryobacterales bacterium]